MLARHVFLVLFLWAASLNGLKWINCHPNSTPELLTVNNSSAVYGIRSYGWPNSLTTLSGKTLFCRFRIQQTAFRHFAVVFLHAHISMRINDRPLLNLDTNNNSVSPIMLPRSVIRPVDIYTTNQPEDLNLGRWSGFEAIVANYEDESKCPLETGELYAQIDESNPTFVASSWDLERNNNRLSLPRRLCAWGFVPKAGQTLKLVFSVFTLDSDNGEQLTLYDADKPIFNFGATQALSSQRVFYTNASFRLEYSRVERNASEVQFFAVVSAFPEKPAKVPDFQCQLNTQMTLEKITLIQNNVEPKNADAFLTPYDNQQECSWQINTVTKKELRFYVERNDFESCCDVATLTTPNNSLVMSAPTVGDFSPVIATRGAENASIYWKSDGNYGRSGFRIRAEVLDCSCGPTNIDFTNASSSTAFGPSHGKSGAYCRNMTCEWTLTFPAKSILVLRTVGSLRGCQSKNSLGDSLIIKDSNGKFMFSTNNCNNWINQYFYSSTGKMTVGFNSSDILPLTNDDDSTLNFHPILLRSSTIKNTPRVLTEANDFELFNSSDTLTGAFSSQTFQLGPNMTSNRLQLFVLSLTDILEASGILVIDGKVDSHGSVTDLTSVGGLDTDSWILRHPFVSKTGIITLVRMTTSTRNHKILIKVYDETRECYDQQSLFLSAPYSPVEFSYKATSLNEGQTHCGLTIYANDVPSGHTGFRLSSYSLSGSDDAIKVFPGVDVTKTPFCEFNRTTLPLWTDTYLIGQLFTILVPINAYYSFGSAYYSPPRARNGFVQGDAPREGVIMSPFYPFGSKEKGLTNTFQYVKDYLRTDFEFELFVESFSPQSSLDVYADSELIYSFDSTNVTSLQPSYKAGIARTLAFNYTGPAAEKGFFVRYSAKPLPGSGVSVFLSMVLAMITVFVHLFN